MAFSTITSFEEDWFFFSIILGVQGLKHLATFFIFNNLPFSRVVDWSRHCLFSNQTVEIVQNSFWCKGCKYSMSFTSCTITSAHLVIEQTSAFFVFFFFLFLFRGGWGGVQLVRTVICFVFWFFPCSKGFSLDSLIYLPSQKPTLQFLIRSRCTDIS